MTGLRVVIAEDGLIVRDGVAVMPRRFGHEVLAGSAMRWRCGLPWPSTSAASRPTRAAPDADDHRRVRAVLAYLRG
jgi:hypothetical protein